MQRTKLVNLIRAAADEAGLPYADRHALVRYANDPSVTRVARGTYRRKDCVCPAFGAGLITEANLADPAPKFERECADVEIFTRLFDVATIPEDGDRLCKVIEVEG